MEKGWVSVDPVLHMEDSETTRIWRTGMEEKRVEAGTGGAMLLSGRRFSRQREMKAVTLRQELAGQFEEEQGRQCG